MKQNKFTLNLGQEMISPHIVIVDDSFVQIESTIRLLTEQIDGLRMEYFETAQRFTEQLEKIQKTPPQVFVLDLFVPWNRENEFAYIGNDIYEKFKGGFLLARHLRNYRSLKNIPIIFSSALEIRSEQIAEFSPAWASTKSDAAATAQLIYSVISAQAQIAAPKKTWVKKAFDVLELKPGAFGLKVDLKRLLKKRDVRR